MEAIVIYWSHTGNTEKVALAIQEGLKDAGARVTMRRVEEAEDVDFFAYDLVCIGFPSYQWSPPQTNGQIPQCQIQQVPQPGLREVRSTKYFREKRLDILHLFRPPYRNS